MKALWEWIKALAVLAVVAGAALWGIGAAVHNSHVRVAGESALGAVALLAAVAWAGWFLLMMLSIIATKPKDLPDNYYDKNDARE